MAITMSLIASDKYSAIRENLLSKIFCAEVCEDVIVMGYRCSDLDLTPIIESFTGKKSRIFFIDHHASVNELKISLVSKKAEKNPFGQYDGLRFFANTDRIVKHIWLSLLKDEYLFNSPIRIEWKENIDEWYSNSVKESGQGVKHHIASRLLYAIGEFKEAIEHHKKAIVIAMNDKNLLAYSSELGNMGMAFNALGDLEQADFCLSESIPLCRNIGNIQALYSQLQAYGNVLHHKGNDKEALIAHHEALYYAEIENDESAISNILGNMSNSYNKLGELDNALKALNRALSLSRKNGKKQAESSQLGILSTTHILMGNHLKAVEYCIQGVEIKKTIGDQNGECQMLVNLLGLYRLLDKREDALKVAKECQILCRKIGNTKVEQMVMLNLAML